MGRPSFCNMPLAAQEDFGNGIGPKWFPAWLRDFITKTLSGFFSEASWRHHDYGYWVGGTERDRAICDRKFAAAMLRDSLSLWHEGQKILRLLSVPVALTLSIIFYAAVRLFGWRSFNYRRLL